MTLQVVSIRASAARLQPSVPGLAPVALNLTSRGPEPWVRFSPFYPHGDIPVPLSPGYTAASVEGIWQGLKVFEGADVDLATFANTTMRGLKRTVRRFGPVRGHRAGVQGERLLSYVEARRAIYLPAYRWVLEHRLADLVERLRGMNLTNMVYLQDYETNVDVGDPARPLSHAGLVKLYVEDAWPREDA